MKPWEKYQNRMPDLPVTGDGQYVDDIGVLDMTEEDILRAIDPQAVTKPWEKFSPEMQGPVDPNWRYMQESHNVQLPDSQKGFFARVGEDMVRRANMGQEIDAARMRGEQGAIESGFQKAGKVGAGLLNDVVTEGFVSAGRGLSNVVPDAIEKPILQAGSNVVDYLGNTAPVRGAMDVAQQAVQAYGDFAENNPRAARNIEATANLGGLLAAGRTAASPRVTGAVDSAVQTGKKSVDKASDFYIENFARYAPDLSSDNVRKLGGELFQKAQAQGGVIAPDTADMFRDKVLSKLSLDGEAKLFSSNPVAERLSKYIDDFKGQPMTFETAKNIDEALGDLAYATADNFGKLDSTGKKFLDLQHDLRSAMDTLPNSETINEARKFWSASLKMRDIERIIEKASSREQPVTSLKNGFSNLLNSKAILKYSPAEVKAIERAAKTGIVTDAVKLTGSGLVPIIAGAGGAAATGGVGALAAIPAYAVQQGAKNVGVSRQMGRANDALQSVVRNSVNAPTKKLTMKQIMALPPDEAKFYLSQLPKKEAQALFKQ